MSAAAKTSFLPFVEAVLPVTPMAFQAWLSGTLLARFLTCGGRTAFTPKEDKPKVFFNEVGGFVVNLFTFNLSMDIMAKLYEKKYNIHSVTATLKQAINDNFPDYKFPEEQVLANLKQQFGDKNFIFNVLKNETGFKTLKKTIPLCFKNADPQILGFVTHVLDGLKTKTLHANSKLALLSMGVCGIIAGPLVQIGVNWFVDKKFPKLEAYFNSRRSNPSAGVIKPDNNFSPRFSQVSTAPQAVAVTPSVQGVTVKSSVIPALATAGLVCQRPLFSMGMP